MKIINVVVFTTLTASAYAGSGDVPFENVSKRRQSYVKISACEKAEITLKLAKLRSSLKTKKQALSGDPYAFRKRRKISERTGYYYLDDPTRRFVPISIRRDRHRNVKWIYPARGSSTAVTEYNSTLAAIKKLETRLVAIGRGKVNSSRTGHTTSPRKKTYRPTSTVPPKIPVPSFSPSAPPNNLSLKTLTFSEEDALQKKHIGKSRSEILQELGKPTTTMTVGRIILWGYKRHHKDSITGNPKDMSVIFQNGKVKSLSFIESISFLPFPKPTIPPRLK